MDEHCINIRPVSQQFLQESEIDKMWTAVILKPSLPILFGFIGLSDLSPITLKSFFPGTYFQMPTIQLSLCLRFLPTCGCSGFIQMWTTRNSIATVTMARQESKLRSKKDKSI